MSSVLQKLTQALPHQPRNKMPNVDQIVRTSYSSLPVSYPADFLAPVADPSVISVQKIDFKNTVLPEYAALYAVVLDNVLSQQECDELIHFAEQSAGAHANAAAEVNDNGWRPAMVNAGRNHEVLAPEYRNSDRIIWDEKEIVSRLWGRVMQGAGMREQLGALTGEEYDAVLGMRVREGERWVARGLNDRMRFLRYGAGQFFREHCDGAYMTEDGSQQSFYTIHLYLNDSEQALGVASPDSRADLDSSSPRASKPRDPTEPLRGGATTFHSRNRKNRLDVDPKAGRVLIFQHKRLIHSGDDVISGTKYTMRSDLMYEYEGGASGSEESE